MLHRLELAQLANFWVLYIRFDRRIRLCHVPPGALQRQRLALLFLTLSFPQHLGTPTSSMARCKLGWVTCTLLTMHHGK